MPPSVRSKSLLTLLLLKKSPETARCQGYADTPGSLMPVYWCQSWLYTQRLFPVVLTATWASSSHLTDSWVIIQFMSSSSFPFFFLRSFQRHGLFSFISVAVKRGTAFLSICTTSPISCGVYWLIRCAKWDWLQILADKEAGEFCNRKALSLNSTLLLSSVNSNANGWHDNWQLLLYWPKETVFLLTLKTEACNRHRSEFTWIKSTGNKE